jgi:hypothetical protein
MPVCASLMRLADATWTLITWDEMVGWLQTLLIERSRVSFTHMRNS